MDDIKLRDLSRIPDAKLSQEEREELRRRYDEFVGRLRKEGGLPEPRAEGKSPKIKPWTPNKSARRG